MNKKTLFYIPCLTLSLIFIFWYFLRGNISDISQNSNKTESSECLIFQSEYPERACFRQVPTRSIPETPSKINPDTCEAHNPIEAEDCVIREAKETKAIDVCAKLDGVAKEKCLGTALYEAPVDTRIITLSKPLAVKMPLAKASSDTVTPFQNSPFTSINRVINAENIDPRTTLDGLRDRLKEFYPVRLYGFSEYQVAPGTEIDAYGVNFTKTDNVVVIGGSRITGLSSSDGFTIHFTVPSLSSSTYDAYVENANGNSQNNQKVSLVISTNPAPRPVIESATPNPALPTDTVVLTGKGLLSNSALVTTLGVLGSVSGDGNSLRFNVGDLEKTKELVKSGQLKGQLFPLFIYVQNTNGINKDFYTLGVQF